MGELECLLDGLDLKAAVQLLRCLTYSMLILPVPYSHLLEVYGLQPIRDRCANLHIGSTYRDKQAGDLIIARTKPPLSKAHPHSILTVIEGGQDMTDVTCGRGGHHMFRSP